MEQGNNLEQLRHSTAHLIAHAVLELFPGTLLTIGPSTEDGFFYDFLPTRNFKEEDLPIIEARMHEISRRNIPIIHKQIPVEEARKLFANNRFKMQLIDEIDQPTVGITIQGDFIDLCKGGHVASTGEINYFKLLNISGSYWKADRNGQALQRITGTAFFSQQDLDAYLQRQADLIQYDHRRLGKQLDLFSFHEEGPGFAFFHPKGKTIFNLLIEYMRGLQKELKYQEIGTPTIMHEKLWHQSGHFSFFKDKMYFCHMEEQTYAVKPMNCPGAILIYSERPRSYRELPLRLSEFGFVHRYELSGVLHGLMRVRGFTIDDTHLFCMIDQVEQEITAIIGMMQRMLTRFGFNNIMFAVSTRPDESMGTDADWEKAINALRNALKTANIPFKIQEKEGAFYGPKIEVKIEDSMGREWQCGTVQVDFNMPLNFDLSFINAKGEKERPVMVHQAIYGSVERFFAILLEHTKGNLPFWISPIQVRVMPITDEQRAYAQGVAEQLKKAGLRVEIDQSGDPLSGQIKTAQAAKIPWMLVIGKKEAEGNVVTLRHRDGKQEPNLSVAALIEKAHQEMTI